MLSYQVLLAAALLIVSKPRASVCQDFNVGPVDLQISPTSPVDVGSATVMFSCTGVVTCTNNAGCMNITVDVTWRKDGVILDVMGDSTYMLSTSMVDIIQPSANSSNPVSFVLMTNGAVLFSHAGSYQCEVSYNMSIPSVSSSSQSLEVQFPSNFLSVSLTPSDPVGTVGSPITLTCTATLTVEISEATFSFNHSFMNNSVRAMSGIMQTSDIFMISPVVISSAGDYDCTVTVTVSGVCGGGGSEPACPTMTSDDVTLTVRFPDPLITSVVLTPVNQTRAVDSSITFTCTAVLAVDVLEAMIEFNFLSPLSMMIPLDAVPGVMQTATATPLSVTLSSAVDYRCSVSVTAAGVCAADSSAPSCPSMTSDPVALTVITISTTELIRLDISPYNAFELVCTLRSPAGSNLMTTFSWTEQTAMVPGNTSLSNSTASRTPVGSIVTDTLAVLLKSVTPNTTPTYTYQCMVGVVGGNLVDVSATVTVRGPVSPNAPLLGEVTTFPERAVIQFSVSSIAYDPENYTVMLATDANNLTAVNGILGTADPTDLTFLTAANINYTIDVDGLVIFQRYYYVIVANNSVGSTNSTLGNFTTSEAPPGPPSNPNLRIDTENSLYLSWDRPDEPNGNITGYRYSCRVTSSMAVIQQQAGLLPNVTSAIITGGMVGITPFTNYTCLVFASTAPGEGTEPATATGISASAVPTGPPLNFNGVSTNPNILRLSWNDPEESRRNGEIIRYNYLCEGVHNGIQGTEQMSVDVTGLTAFQQYTCYVGAATVNGTGPSATVIQRTAEDIPGAVNSLSVTGLNTQFSVRWAEPTITNGVVANYYVLVYYATTSDRSLAAGRGVLGALTETVVVGLEMFVPYNVTVLAATTAGNGTGRSVIDFTQEGTPGGVTVSNVNRINGTHMTVTWVPLTLEEARGFITEYTIIATPTDELRKRQDSGIVQANFPSTATSGTLGGLESNEDYAVTVVGNTMAGAGQQNPAVLVPTVASSGTGAGAIAAAVIVTLLLVGVLVAVIVVLVYVYFRMYNKVPSSVSHDRLEEVELKDAKKKEILIPDPIPVEEFAKHAAKQHHNKDLGFEEEYSTFKYLAMGPHVVCKLPHNTPKNRFENVFPFDHARVRLTEVEGEQGSDYINASWIDGYRREKAYIASQGPLVNTVSDFWRTVWEYKTHTVVMLTELIERGVNKCHQYWPKNINEKMDLRYDLHLTLVEQRAYVEYKLKRMVLVNTSDEDEGKLEVTHYHFTAWPDHGVPADKTCMLAFIKRIRKAHPPTGPPLLVHCSAGVGRTGTFITLDTMLQRMKEENNLNIPEFVKEMRSKRVLMVQTEAQYIYIHDALAEFITCGDTSIHATSAIVYKRIQHLQKVTNHQSGFQHQFELLRQVSIKPAEGHCSDALSAQNSDKNRYRHLINTLPFNFNRVRLKPLSGEGDYINASYVDGYKHRGAFLATQAPLDSTVNDLWRMVWENQSKAMITLCEIDQSDDDDDDDKKQDEEEHFPQYWPTTPGETSTYGKLTVKLVSEKEESYCTVRKMELAMDSNYINMGGSPKGSVVPEFVLTQFHYTKWPKSGKPTKPGQLVRLVDNLIKTQSNTGNNPITVMCSDGVGRTGAFICIYSVLERVKTEGVADIFQFIKSSRFQRSGLVKELDQYILCHEVLQEFLSTFDNYANF